MTTQLSTSAIRLIPGNIAPTLAVDMLARSQWSLSEQKPQNFTMVVFYRGLHCPLCAEYLQELESLLKSFKRIGIETVAISGDDHQRAADSAQEWGLQTLQLGYGLTREAMQQWGLYVSRGELDGEPPFFSEPGLFLIWPDGVLFFAGVNNAPYGRTDLNTLIAGLEYVLDNNYPIRGTEV
ncbi:MAG: peroxiredoxin-like family protein [Nodosilinea sp.]